MNAGPDVEQEYRLIRIDLIRDPHEPVRETMDEEKMADLVASIKAVGLIEPIVVKDCNEYFEVVAGHRRLKACRAANVTEVPSIIRRNKTVSQLAIMIHENAFREDMNPIEQARFYASALIEEADNDVDKLCEMLKRERPHVEGRLLLLFGHPAVVTALEQGKIPISTARALNKLQNVGYLPQLLDSAVNQGATSRQVAEWVRESDQLPPIDVQLPAAANADGSSSATVVSSVPQCIFCQSQKYAHMMHMVWLHHHCQDALNGMMSGNAPQQ